MPSDYGDEAGEKLFDWMLGIAQDSSESIMLKSAERLKSAFHNARGSIEQDGEAQPDNTERWVKLNMQEFTDLPEYQTIQEVIEEELAERGVEHSFIQEENETFLLFKAADAPDVSEAFAELEERSEKACEKALEARGKSREEIRDSEPLEERAKAARDASKAIEAERGIEPELERAEVKTK